MLRHLRVSALAAAVFLGAMARPMHGQAGVASPDGRNRVTLEIREGRLYYSLARDGRALILPSLLGFEFRGAPRLRDGLRLTDSTRQTHDGWWTQPWGEVARVPLSAAARFALLVMSAGALPSKTMAAGWWERISPLVRDFLGAM